MALALYLDHHVRREVAVALRHRGVDVLTCLQDGTTELPDPGLLDRAMQLGRVFVSQDVDLLVEAQRRQKTGLPFAGLIYSHQLWVPAGRMIADLELMAKALAPEELAGRVEYLPLK